jgi:hypothetical protein
MWALRAPTTECLQCDIVVRTCLSIIKVVLTQEGNTHSCYLPSSKPLHRIEPRFFASVIRISNINITTSTTIKPKRTYPSFEKAITKPSSDICRDCEQSTHQRRGLATRGNCKNCRAKVCTSPKVAGIKPTVSTSPRDQGDSFGCLSRFNRRSPTTLRIVDQSS